MIRIRKIWSLMMSFMVTVGQLTAQNVTISGNDPDYAGCKLSFYSIDNYFCNSEVKLGECTVTADGSFTAGFPCRNTRQIYTCPGVFHVRFFVEPGYSYEVKLPPRTDKSPEEKESPFFEMVTVYMNILSVSDSNGQKVVPEKELNMLINRFDETFNPLYDRLALDAFAQRPATLLDSTINAFCKDLPHTGNRYFDAYAFHRSGLLYYAAQRSGVKYISNTYFSDTPPLYDNEAYMELFNTTYDRYFMYFGRTGNAIYDVINTQKSFGKLKHLLKQDGVLLADSLCELVILKNIYDEFYSDRFKRESLLRLLDSAIVETAIDRHRELAVEIRAKVTKLLRGFEPPAFSLYNHDSTLVSLQQYHGKYVYLMFCTTQNYACLSQYPILEKLHGEHGKWLQIVVVSADDHLSNMRDFRNNSRYQWDFLHFANDPNILNNYDIRIFPTCYLIDPEGKLVLSPAPAAGDNLEKALWQELNSKGLWQEYVRKGWITVPRNTDKRFNPDF